MLVYANHGGMCMLEEERLIKLQNAVEKFLLDISTLPPWESAGALWGIKVKELHSVWLDSKGL